MSHAHEDPRLTAYALGELSGEEQIQIEALLARDARARTELEGIRDVSSRLERGLSGAHGPALSERRRASLRALMADRVAATHTASKHTARSAKTQPRLWMLAAALVPATVVALLVLRENATLQQLRVERQQGPTSQRLAAPNGGVEAVPDRDKELLATERAPAAAAPTLFSRRAPELRAAPAAEIIAGFGKPARLSQTGNEGGMESLWADSVPDLRAAQGTPLRETLGGSALSFGTGDLGLQRESYDAIEDNPFVQVSTDPRSTFSIDVDTAAYALVRRFLDSGKLPPLGAVRIEELINYFSYGYPQPSADDPVSVVASLAVAPWNREHQLVRIALAARHVAASARPPANLVFLIDVSGSMDAPNKLGLVKYGLRQLTHTLGAQDRVSIVTYAGKSGVVLPPTSGAQQAEILGAIDQLEASGSTNGGAGLLLAYMAARSGFVAGNVNRVLLATDGDFNVGVTSQSDLVDLIEREAKTGVFLSVLGFGDGNYQDSTMEKLADHGNGNYAYIDGQAEAKKVLVEQATGTLLTLAKDVKLQLEFNPQEVSQFRLIGYENRKLEHRDFNDDAKDAGELGADHSVTALYEVVRAGQATAAAAVDPLVYQPPAAAAPTPPAAFQGQLLHVKLRYQPPAGGPSRLLEQTLNEPVRDLDADFRFAAAVAEFGMLLRHSPHRGQASYSQVLKLAETALGDGPDRQARAQFVELVRKARRLAAKSDAAVSP